MHHERERSRLRSQRLFKSRREKKKLFSFCAKRGCQYARFNIDKDPLLLTFVENLQPFDGGKRSEREAREMALDVFKYLAFVRDEAKWQSLLR